jgi:hypothetical protein
MTDDRWQMTEDRTKNIKHRMQNTEPGFAQRLRRGKRKTDDR